jgi:hypothetical protein
MNSKFQSPGVALAALLISILAVPAARALPPPAVATPPVTPAVPVAPTASTNAAISTGAQTSAQATANQASGAINSNVAGSAATQVDSNGIVVNGTATNNTAIARQTPGLSVAGANSNSISASLNSADTVAQINGTALQTRDGVVTRVNGQIQNADQAMGNLRTTGRELKGDARKQFDAAYDDVRARERDLKRSLREANNAKDETWMDARSKLASNYDAYVQAMARAEAAAQVNATANVQ